MATLQRSSRAVRLPVPRRRRWLRIALVVAAILAAAIVLSWDWLSGSTRTATAVGARAGCACRYIAGRPIGECRADFEDGMEAVMLSDDPASRSVTARIPPFARETAQFRPGEGCILQPWGD